MGEEVDAFDVVIKIRKLDDYRTRPKTSAPAQPVQRFDNRSSSYDESASIMGSFESKVLSIVERHPQGIKARDIADKLGEDKSKVNSLLYSLKYKGKCKIDEQYRWTLLVNKSNVINSSSRQDCVTPASNVNSSVTNKVIAPYINYFEHLSVGKRGDLRAPHKYVLLIAIINLIQKGIIASNRFKPSTIIDDEFKKTWASIVKAESPFKPHPTYPYWHLMSEPFWKLLHLYDGTSISVQWEKPILSEAKQRKELMIELDQGLFNLAKDKDSCEQLIQSLVRCYNSPILSVEKRQNK